MPVISQFLGIAIIMFWDDHNPPHFHAKYGKYEIIVYIKDGTIDCKFPKRALRLVMEWYEIHKSELLENWKLAEAHKPLCDIAPLE